MRALSLDMDASIQRLLIVNHSGDGTLNLDKPYSLRVESANVESFAWGEMKQKHVYTEN